MQAYFLVDFGMTSSTGEGIAIPPPDVAAPIKYHRLCKTPTTILYDQDGNCIRIGDRYVGRSEMFTEFKTDFPRRHLDPANPSPVDKLISDYLRHFCGDLLNQFLQEENTIKDNLDAEWYLTTPGCWRDQDRLDFQLLAQKVLVDLLPGSKVYADISESVASCEFLVEHLQLSAGTWVITSDVGGGTIDTALCIAKKEGGKIIPEVFPIAFDTSSLTLAGSGHTQGVGSVDEELLLLLRRFMDAMDITNVDEIEEVEKISFSHEWETFRHAFRGDNDFTITMKSHVWNGKEGSFFGVSLRGKTITIQRATVELLFVPIVHHLSVEIQTSMAKIKHVYPKRARPDLIALCGGGGVMAYLLEQVGLRYIEIPIKTPVSAELSCHATIAGHRTYRLRQITQKYLSEISLGVTSPSSTKESSKTIEWREEPSRQTIFNFTSPARNTQVHYFLAHSKGGVPPTKLDVHKLSKDPGPGRRDLIWRLELTLAKEWMRKQEYSIEIECTGRGRGSFRFKAYDTKNGGTAVNLVSEAYFFDG